MKKANQSDKNNPTSIKNKNTLSNIPIVSLLSDEYNKILVALQALYSDRDRASDQIIALKDDLEVIKSTLISILQYQKELSDFETKLFRKNLST